MAPSRTHTAGSGAAKRRPLRGCHHLLDAAMRLVERGLLLLGLVMLAEVLVQGRLRHALLELRDSVVAVGGLESHRVSTGAGHRKVCHLLVPPASMHGLCQPTICKSRLTNKIAPTNPLRSQYCQRSLTTAEPLVIVSNRGPKDFVWKDGAWTPVAASGGLVSMLAPLAQREDVRWFCCVSEPPDASHVAAGLFTTAADQLGGPLHVIPIPLAAPMYHAYYGQISNEILWMLQHRILGAGGFDAIDAARHRAWSQGYLQANARLAAEIQRHSGARAFLLQDYHLYPLPALLRSAFPSTPILHFTHIPFPDPPLMKLLPREWRETILRGLLGADIVGVQTRADVEAFVSCCDAFLGCSVHHRDPAVRAEDGRWVSVRPYPASVEPAEIEHTMRSEAVEDRKSVV